MRLPNCRAYLGAQGIFEAAFEMSQQRLKSASINSGSELNFRICLASLAWAAKLAAKTNGRRGGSQAAEEGLCSVEGGHLI